MLLAGGLAVLAMALEDWSENRESRELSSLPNIAERMACRPSLVTFANAYCAIKPDNPRIVNRSINDSGTSHRLKVSF